MKLRALAAVVILGPSPGEVTVTAPGTNALGDNGAAGILAHVNFICSGIGLLAIVCQGYRVELITGVIAAQHHTQDTQVIAEPVSTWVQEIFARAPAH